MYQNFAVKGESIPPTEIVPAAKQREILGLLLDTLDPANLAIPEPLLASLTDAVEEEPRSRRPADPIWRTSKWRPAMRSIQLSAARTVAGLVFDQLFEPEKAARLISFADRQDGALDVAGAD